MLCLKNIQWKTVLTAGNVKKVAISFVIKLIIIKNTEIKSSGCMQSFSDFCLKNCCLKYSIV